VGPHERCGFRKNRAAAPVQNEDKAVLGSKTPNAALSFIPNNSIINFRKEEPCVLGNPFRSIELCDSIVQVGLLK